MKLQSLLQTMMVAGLSLALVAPVLAQTASQPNRSAQSMEANRGQLSERDYRFVVKAAQGGMEEVQLGQLAEQKGQSEAVRNFGQHMVQQHTQANDQLKQLAAQKGLTLPAKLSHGEQSTRQHLQNASGAEFDRLYAKDMVKDHRHDVKEFETAAKNLQDPEIKAWAQQTLPILQHHLSMAEQLEGTVKNSKSSR